MTRAARPVLAVLLLALSAACAAPRPRGREGALVAHLGRPGGDQRGLDELRRRFARSSNGCELWYGPIAELGPSSETRVLFVQEGAGWAGVQRSGTRLLSEVVPGDVILLRPGESLASEPGLRALGFQLAGQPPPGIPSFLRPDVDEAIVDAPGGCAPETGAYRRLILTWLPENGPYVFRALNAHRVRIVDSPTHYHPLEGGFDEFYLVQEAEPGARLLVSRAVESIETGRVEREETATLFETIPLERGDLVHLPRGTIHRGLGGILAQVIALPGFVPGGEIVLDDQLHALNRRLAPSGAQALPVHEPPAPLAVAGSR
jgi:hypothetical protein